MAFRETITKRVENIEGKFVRQSGGKGQYGHVVIHLEPNEAGKGFVFEDKIVGGTIPREFIKPVEAGIREALDSGVLAGYPVVDVKVTLVYGSYHDVDSSEMAFKIAGSMAFKEAARQAKPIILEPIMEVEVVAPSDYMGDVIGDLSSRRGKIGGMTQRGDAQVVAADVPLAEMFGYSTTLRSMTPGPRRVLDAVRSLRGSAEVRRRRDHHQGEATADVQERTGDAWRRRNLSGRSRT